MKSTDEDHRRLLLSRSSSADDLEALASPAANGPSQLKAMADSASDTDTIFVEHKSPKLHNLYKAMTGRRYAYLCSLRLIRYLVTFLVLTIVLFFTYTLWPKDREIALSKWAPTTEEWVKPTSFKIIGMVFCEHFCGVVRTVGYAPLTFSVRWPTTVRQYIRLLFEEKPCCEWRISGRSALDGQY